MIGLDHPIHITFKARGPLPDALRSGRILSMGTSWRSRASGILTYTSQRHVAQRTFFLATQVSSPFHPASQNHPHPPPPTFPDHWPNGATVPVARSPPPAPTLPSQPRSSPPSQFFLGERRPGQNFSVAGRSFWKTNVFLVFPRLGVSKVIFFEYFLCVGFPE